MVEPNYPIAIVAKNAALRTKPSNYPEPVASHMAGRAKQPLGDIFGLANFGVNLTTLASGAVSSLRHMHSKQDEFVYILAGHPTLVRNAGHTPLASGMCAGFKADNGDAHQLVNLTNEPAAYLEVGDRSAADAITYPDDDIVTMLVKGEWQFVHKDGRSY